MKCIVCKIEKKYLSKDMCGACYAKWYRKTYPERVKEYNRRTRKERLKKAGEYYKKNRKKLLKKQAEIWTKKYHNNPEFKKKCQFRYKTVGR